MHNLQLEVSGEKLLLWWSPVPFLVEALTSIFDWIRTPWACLVLIKTGRAIQKPVYTPDY